jgi:hypothetical protein
MGGQSTPPLAFAAKLTSNRQAGKSSYNSAKYTPASIVVL